MGVPPRIGPNGGEIPYVMCDDGEGNEATFYPGSPEYDHALDLFEEGWKRGPAKQFVVSDEGCLVCGKAIPVIAADQDVCPDCLPEFLLWWGRGFVR